MKPTARVVSLNRRLAAQERVAIAYRLNGPFSLYRGVSPSEVTALAKAARADRKDVRTYLRAHGHTCERRNPRRPTQMVDFVVSHLDGYAFVLEMDELRDVTKLGTPTQRAAWLASITESLRTIERFRRKLLASASDAETGARRPRSAAPTGRSSPRRIPLLRR